MSFLLLLVIIFFQLLIFTLVYRRVAEPFPRVRLPTALIFFVSTIHIIVGDFIGLSWVADILQAITAWILLYSFIKQIHGSKAWIRTHLWQYKWIVAVLAVCQVVNAAFLTSSGQRENRNNEHLSITLHIIHLAAFFILILRSKQRSPSAAFFVYNSIVLLQPLGTTLKLFTEFPADVLYCREYYNCREYMLKLQYFLFSVFALVDLLPAILLCLDGVCMESELPRNPQAHELTANYEPILDQESH